MASFPIVFVRHGESEANIFIHNNDPDAGNKIDNLGDPKLSELGKSQAESVGKSLIKHLIESGTPSVNVLISKFTRAIETSKYFTNHYPGKLTSNITSELIEFTPVKKNLSQVHLDSGIFHDQTWDDFKDRVIKFCNEYLNEPPKETIIVFGHSLFISCLVSYISSHRRLFPEKNELCFRFPNCSITSVLWDDERKRWVIDHVASIAHMPLKLITGTHTMFGNKIN